ncbi:MAG: hypothetical protein R2860_06125 [Desulfobacterales bacterium]
MKPLSPGIWCFPPCIPTARRESITRLLDMGMLNPFNFADALLAIMAQRLVRTL